MNHHRTKERVSHRSEQEKCQLTCCSAVTLLLISSLQRQRNAPKADQQVTWPQPQGTFMRALEEIEAFCEGRTEDSWTLQRPDGELHSRPASDQQGKTVTLDDFVISSRSWMRLSCQEKVWVTEANAQEGHMFMVKWQSSKAAVGVTYNFCLSGAKEEEEVWSCFRATEGGGHGGWMIQNNTQL